eukprot:7468599-Pyramimonas_sp.AAC.4
MPSPRRHRPAPRRAVSLERHRRGLQSPALHRAVVPCGPRQRGRGRGRPRSCRGAADWCSGPDRQHRPPGSGVRAEGGQGEGGRLLRNTRAA